MTEVFEQTLLLAIALTLASGAIHVLFSRRRLARLEEERRRKAGELARQTDVGELRLLQASAYERRAESRSEAMRAKASEEYRIYTLALELKNPDY